VFLIGKANRKRFTAICCFFATMVNSQPKHASYVAFYWFFS
jgi:hypothetical protein